MEEVSEEKKETNEENVASVVEAGERGDDKVIGGVIIGDTAEEQYSSESDEGVRT